MILPKSRKGFPHNYPKHRKPPEVDCHGCRARVPMRGSERVNPTDPKSPMLCQICAYRRRAS